jgi:hypothetical protein
MGTDGARDEHADRADKQATQQLADRQQRAPQSRGAARGHRRRGGRGGVVAEQTAQAIADQVAARTPTPWRCRHTDAEAVAPVVQQRGG